MKTGSITALEEFARDANHGACTLQRAGKDAWLACPIAEQPNGDVYDPFGVMRVQLDGTTFKPERPALVRSGEAELRTSPSGGVMVLGPCTSDGEGEVCVHQPDGRWVTVNGEAELYTRGVGPLSDGRVAFLRNMWNGDVPETHRAGDEHDEDEEDVRDEDDPEAVGERDEREVPERKRLYVAAVGDGRKEERIATIAWRPMGDLRVQSPIQEDDDHNVHFIVSDDEGVYAVVQPMDKEARPPQRLEGMSEARLRGSRGIAVGMDGIRATTDGGRTWAGVPLPTRARESLAQIDSLATDPSTFGVSDVGLLLDRSVRVGWGASDNIEEAIEPVFDTTLPSISRVSVPERMFTCSIEANVPGTPALSSSTQVSQLLGKKPQTPTPKGTRRLVGTSSSTRDGVMGVVALLEEEGSDKAGSVPTKWSITWHDPAELGGKPRSWSGAPPKDTPWGAQIRGAVGSGARVVFTMRIGSKNLLIRTNPRGGVETAHVTPDLLPSNDIVFGSDKGEPIVWLRDTALVVWLSGEAPRVIGHVSYRSNRLLGEPTKDGVTVLLGGQDWSALRVFSIPPMDKKGPVPAPPSPTLDGWIAAPNLQNHLGRFGVCTSKPKGATRFSVPRSYARATIDTAGGSLGNARYDVYLTGADACIAQLTATHSPDRSSPRTPSGAANAPKKGPITFVRADFIGKRAEGGVRGLPAKDAMHKLTCTLEERK